MIYLTIFSEIGFKMYPIKQNLQMVSFIPLGIMAILWIGVIGGVLLAMGVKKTKLKAVP